MRRGISLPNFGDYANPGTVVEMAIRAEAAGWEGFFVWDHIVVADGVDVADPWVLLGAIAQATRTISIGPMVTPLPRRRPWVVARQATSLDHLSQGRLILGIGIGFPPDVEFGTFAEPMGDRERANMLDEGLEVLAGIWSGDAFGYDGENYTVHTTTFGPRPVRSSGIPIWVGAMWPNRRPMLRAARYQGVFPVKMDMTPWRPAEVRRLRAMMGEIRGDLDGFDVVIGGTFDSLHQSADAYAESGATWYLASPDMDDSVDDLTRVIEAGPDLEGSDRP